MERRVLVEAVVRAPRGVVFAQLADSSGWCDWIPGVVSCRVLAREGGLAVVEAQAPRYPGAEFVFECVESPGQELAFSQLDRDSGRGLSGRVSLEDAESGRASAVRVRAVLSAPWWQLGAGRRLRVALAAALDGLRGQVARAAARSGEARRLVFSAILDGNQLEVLQADRVFRVPLQSGGDPK